MTRPGDGLPLSATISIDSDDFSFMVGEGKVGTYENVCLSLFIIDVTTMSYSIFIHDFN